MPSFARELEQTLHNALAEASKRRHEYATLEHLLIALVDDEHASKVMTACGVSRDELRSSVKQYLDNELGALVADSATDPTPTSGFQRVVQRAILHVQSSGRDEVTGANVLVALFSERESYAVYFLQQQDMSRLDAVTYISHGVGKGETPAETRAPEGTEEKTEKESGKKESALKQFTVDLNEKARTGKVDPLIGRMPEVERTVQILCRRSKNNPLYVGEPGVGKTAIAEGLGWRRRQARGEAGSEERREQEGFRTRPVHRQPQRQGAGRQGRSADRARPGSGPHDPDPVPPLEEQPALCR